MFRKMRRANQALTDEERADVLTSQKRGVLSVIGDDGYPDGMPLNHLYCPENGHIYFHGGKLGHRVDAVKACDKVSYCVFDEGYRKDGEWALNVRSVIVFGRMRPVEDEEEAITICRRLSRRFTSDDDYIEDEIRRVGAATLVLELIPEHISGKLVNES